MSIKRDISNPGEGIPLEVSGRGMGPGYPNLGPLSDQNM